MFSLIQDMKLYLNTSPVYSTQLRSIVEITYSDALDWVKKNNKHTRGLLTGEVSSEFGTLYKHNKTRREYRNAYKE